MSSTLLRWRYQRGPLAPRYFLFPLIPVNEGLLLGEIHPDGGDQMGPRQLEKRMPKEFGVHVPGASCCE
jgi:hypothetical protein